MLEQKTTVIFDKWLDSLEPHIRAKITVFIKRVLNGNTSNCESVGEGVYEIKINYQKGYRAYYTVINRQTVLLLLCGGNKKGQSKDIALAKEIKRRIAK